ncbi:hypothetical protein GO986_21865 [Deinococcus sp. HMF7620]|uniref:Uncharacterized protein n=1 Tax=Deinococcus arboris TaxID=2682977 RepID=A0A7C9IFF0_9DEIO|nr:hypothetical protein [Deinococcus arboris]MVN89386.1 hypothetical protein [Deinococcus arboris]
MPSGNFWANSSGILKQGSLFTNTTKPKGYQYYLRKGFDPATSTAFIWVVVS